MSDNVRAPKECSTLLYCVSKTCQRPKDAFGNHLRVKSKDAVLKSRMAYRRKLAGYDQQ
jgi:hypothetical protein